MQEQNPVRFASLTPQRRRLITMIALALLAIGVVSLVWYDARSRLGSTQEELARRLRDIETEARDAKLVAQQSQAGLRDGLAKIATLEAKLAESQSQQLALESLYQELSRNRDEWALAEIEQVLTLAAQQLQFTGNVKSAMLALQLAESRLSRSDRPQFVPLRRALARDIERLRALPYLDVAGVSFKLDGLVTASDRLPMAFEERLAEPTIEPVTTNTEGTLGMLTRLGHDVWAELRGLVRVRRLDAPEPPLLAPAQAYFLRENLKLRLLNARLALAMRDQAGFREDVRVAQLWVNRYFDPRAQATVAFNAQLKELAQVPVSVELPTLNDSLDAVRVFKTRRERAPG